VQPEPEAERDDEDEDQPAPMTEQPRVGGGSREDERRGSGEEGSREGEAMRRNRGVAAAKLRSMTSTHRW
jgi:hypothetical protein